MYIIYLSVYINLSFCVYKYGRNCRNCRNVEIVEKNRKKIKIKK